MINNTIQVKASKEPKAFYLIGLLLQLFYILFAIIFFKERIIQGDTSKFFIEIIGSGQFFFINRTIVLFTNPLPLISSNLNGSIKLSMVLYSVNLALMYTIPYLIIAFIYRNKNLTICLLLLQFIYPLNTHYLAIAEMQHGIILLLLYWAHIKHLNVKNKSVIKQPFLIAILFIILNAHPFLLLSFIGSCILFCNQKAYWKLKDQKKLFSIAILILLASAFIFDSDYESNLLKKAISSILVNKPNLSMIKILSVYTLSTHYPMLLVGLVSFYLLLKNYSKISVAAILGLVLTQFFLIYLRYQAKYNVMPYFEIYITTIAFLIFLIFSLHFEKLQRKKINISVIVIVMLFALRCKKVLQIASPIQVHQKLVYSVLNTMELYKTPKSIIPIKSDKEKNSYNSILNYRLPFQSYILSLVDDNDKNDGFIVTYLIGDSINVKDYEVYSNGFIKSSKKGELIFTPFNKYPKLMFIEDPYKIYNPLEN